MHVNAITVAVAVVTIVAGRRGHLANLLLGLQGQTRPADHIVVVTMDGEPVDAPPELAPVMRVEQCQAGTELPLAAARNAGVRAARGLGADAVVLLDVDCIPSPGFVAGYADALSGDARSGLVCGEVRYLDHDVPSPLDFGHLAGQARSLGVRPAPEAHELLRDDRHELAWTTSLGLTVATFELIGGFDERYVGYGAEDTDFGERARKAGVGVWWTGDALSLHQQHGTGGAPRHHVAAIVRNANLFHSEHGWWPMDGWLEQFDTEGLVRWDPAASKLELLA